MDDFYDDYDAHSCSANADADGYCQVCGAIVPGSYAYYETYGGEYPEKPDYDDY